MRQIFERLGRYLNADSALGAVLVLTFVMLVLMLLVPIPSWAAIILFVLFVPVVIYAWRDGRK